MKGPIAFVLPVLFALCGLAPTQEPPAKKVFFRGAKRTPAAKIAAALASGRAMLHAATVKAPPQVAMVPPRLSMWGNSQYGDCVTAESAAAIAAYSTYVLGGSKEIFVTEAAVISWARAHGVLNGADLLSVIQEMQADGIKDENGVLRKEGTPSVVDFSNEAVLQSAIAQGPLSIAIAADSLPSGAGNKSGWYAFGSRNDHNTDHCVSLFGYGPTQFLFGQLGVPVPAGAPTNGYLLYTWNTIGVVDHAWIKGTTDEAWLRTPTVVGLSPPPPPPPPDPTPNPVGAFGSMILRLDADRKAGEYQLKLVGPDQEVNPIGTAAQLEDARKTITELQSRIGPKKAEPPSNPPAKEDQETEEPPIKKKEEVRLRYSDLVHIASGTNSYIAVAVGNDNMPEGNWLKAFEPLGFLDYEGKCLLIGKPGDDCIRLRWNATAQEVNQAIRKGAWLNDSRDPKTGKLKERT